jgi:hypothetical protein
MVVTLKAGLVVSPLQTKMAIVNDDFLRAKISVIKLGFE